MSTKHKAEKQSRRPTLEPHSDAIDVDLCFSDAYQFVKSNPNKLYTTRSGAEFTAMAGVVSRGIHTGKEVVRFMRNGQESARAYQCCWGHRTNCNRTYIDSYSVAIK